jgi:hypothetical protein
VYQQLVKTKEYADTNQMKINFKKTKAMLFNPCSSIDFVPELELDDHEVEFVDELRLLGIIIRSDMKWYSNTENMVNKANKKLWVLRRLKYLGAGETDLVDVFIKQIRSLLELAAPAWHGAITQEEIINIERIQKSAAHIILGEDYFSYKVALKFLNIDTLQSRRDKLCLNFAKKAEKHPKFQKWFRKAEYKPNTRQERFKYCDVKAKHTRLEISPISFLTKMLNEYHNRK